MIYLPRIAKHCRTCKNLLSFSEFTKDMTMGDKMRADCRACRAVNSRLYKRDPDKAKASKARYRSKPETIDKERTYSREYQLAHKDELKAYMDIWRNENYDHILDYNNQHRIKNLAEFNHKRRTKYKENPQPTNVNRQRRRARIKQAPGSHTAEDLQRQLETQKGLCYWCSKPFQNDATIDHVRPLTRGGSNSPSNLVFACRSCNSRKRNRLPYTEWIPPNPLH